MDISRWGQTRADLLRHCLAAMAMLLSLSAQGQDNGPPAAIGGAISKQHAANEQALRAALTEVEAIHGSESEQLASSMHRLASFLHSKGRYAEALPLYKRTLAIREAVLGPDHPETAAGLNDVAATYQTLGRYSEALEPFQLSLAIWEKTLGSDHPHVATGLSNLATLHNAAGRYGEALPLYLRSLAIKEKSLGADHVDVAISLNNLAWLYWSTGRNAEALPLLQRSLVIWEAALGAHHPTVATCLNNLAELYISLGRYAEALPPLQRSLEIGEKALGRDHPSVALSLNTLARLYSALGRYGEALPLQQQSLVIYEKTLGPTHPEVGMLLNNAAWLYRSLGRYSDALPLQLRSLEINELALGSDHRGVSAGLNNLAALYVAMARYAEAVPLYQRSLAISEKTLGPDHPDMAVSLSDLGALHFAMSAFEPASKALHRSIILSQGNPSGREALWRSQYALSRLSALRSQPEQAILWGKESINTIQDLRGGLLTLSQELQSSFLEARRPVYQHLADLLIEQGRLAEAQTVLQMLKEQELHDSLERSANTDPRSTRIELTGLERKRFAKYYELRDQQLELGLERERLERKKKIGEISEAENRRLEEINNKLLPPLRAAMVAFLDALQKSASELAKQEQRRANPDLTLVETNLQRAMQQVQRSVAGTATAALQFVVTDTRLSILLSTPGAPPLARQIEVSAKALRQKVMAARELVSRPPGKLPAASNPEFLNKPLRELYDLLIAPIEADLKSLGVKTMILVPNDVLRYVPFAALMNGDRYLVQDYTLALFNEAVKRDFAPKVSTIWRPAAMGLTRAVANLPALPAVREEVEVVALNAGMTGRAFLDDDFNRVTLTKVLGQDFNVLHLASHFDLVPGRPDASRLFLGDLSALTLGDIARDNLRFDRFSLVAFSACETGLGDTELADGRDMESLGALVQNQGAQAVIATLWKADDKSAATLMALFYRGRSMTGLSKAEALQKAQLQFVAGQAAGHARSHPYFWAPFVLMGDWR